MCCSDCAFPLDLPLWCFSFINFPNQMHQEIPLALPSECILTMTSSYVPPLISLVQTTIFSHLKYGSNLWNDLPPSVFDSRQSILHTTAREIILKYSVIMWLLYPIEFSDPSAPAPHPYPSKLIFYNSFCWSHNSSHADHLGVSQRYQTCLNLGQFQLFFLWLDYHFPQRATEIFPKIP